MPSGDLVARVEVLEEKMTALEELPARVSSLESQIVQLGTGMKGEFSAVRGEMQTMGEGLRLEMRAMGEGLRLEMRALSDELRREMRELNDQTLTHVRVLHEAVIERIARLDEARNGSSRKRQRR